MGGKMEGKRLYVGNLNPEVTQEELKQKFDKFGSVDSAEIKHKTDIDGNKIQTFGFVNLQINDDSLQRCINTLSNKDWKGYQMRVQQAKESFMSRLQKERQGKGTENGNSVEQGRNQNKEQGRNQDKKPDRNQDKGQDRSQDKKQDRRQNKFQANPRISELDTPYDPLALFKNKLATDGIGETTGEKKVSKHLGGNKKDEIRKTPQSEKENGDSNEDQYDAFKKFKERNKPDETEKPKRTGPVDKGKVVDGVVTFSGGDDNKKGRKRKVAAYHSSDEDEEEEEGMKQGVKSSPNKITFENEGKENKRKKEKSKESSKRQKVEEVEELEEDETEEYDAEEEKKRNFEILNKVVAKEAEFRKPKPTPTGRDYMPRFDPTAVSVEKINKKTENSTFQWNRGYDTIPNLKSVFTSSSTEQQGTGFSFGFNTQSQADTSSDDKKPGKSLFKLDAEDQDEKLAKKSENKFGTELLGKLEELPTFFFGTEDLRNKDSMDFFFDFKLEEGDYFMNHQRKKNLFSLFNKRKNTPSTSSRRNKERN